MYGQIVRKVEVCSADAASQGSAERGLQSASAERQQLLGIGEEETGRDLVVSPMKFAIPVRRELVLSVFSRLAHDERSRLPWRACNGGNKKTAIRGAELIALQLEQIVDVWIDTGNCEGRLHRCVR